MYVTFKYVNFGNNLICTDQLFMEDGIHFNNFYSKA